MSLPEQYFYISVQDYLAGEKVSRVRHEYIDGAVHAMAGGTVRHNQITKNIGYRLEEHLANSKCSAYIVDMKVRVSPIIYYYPDVVVTCEELPETGLEIREPRLIVEVLSDSTATIDRREKLLEYRRVPGLQEYVIVWQDEIRVEVHRRIKDNDWQFFVYTQPEQQVALDAVDMMLEVSDIYRRVTFA